MLKIINTVGGSLTANQVIPFNLKYGTNTSISFNNDTNEVSINKEGYYKIDANFVITSTGTTDITIQLYANNVAIPGAKATITPASSTTYSLSINDIEKVIRQYANFDKVKLTFKSSVACTLVTANTSVVEIR